MSPQRGQPGVVSLFSGCGGLDLGFRDVGFELKFAADSDPAAVSAYSANLGHQATLLDVTTPEFATRLDELSSCDVLLGGFPCQGFSKAGPKREGDERNLLYRAMIQALHKLRPAVFVAENVDGLVQNYNGTFLKKIVDDCAAVGYNVKWRVVDAAWFGVPQHRRRIIIVGVRDELGIEFQWPVATHKWIARNGERAIHLQYDAWAEDPVAAKSLKEALVGLSLDSPDHNANVAVSAQNLAILRRISEGKKLCNARHDDTSVRTWDIPEAFGTTSRRERAILESIARNRRHKRFGSIPNGNPLSLDALREVFSSDLEEHELDSLVQRGHLKRIEAKWDLRGAMFASGLYKRPLLDQPCPTVLTMFGSPRYFAHPIEDRPFTVREVARIQSFPDSFEFALHGIAEPDAYRLIGNAVPPRLARAVAVAVLATLRDDAESPQPGARSVDRSHEVAAPELVT